MIGSLLGAALVVAPGQASLAAPKPSKSQLDKQISDASNQLEVVIEQYDTAGVTLAGTKAKIAQVNKQLLPLQRKAQAAHKQVAVIAAGVYQDASPVQTLGRLLDQQSTSVLVNQLSLINQVAHAQGKKVDALNAAAATYVAQKNKLTVLENAQNNEYVLLKVKRASIKKQIAQLTSLRVAAYGSAGGPSDPVIHYVPVFSADAAGQAVRFAYNQLGKAYRFGASGPNAYDCSGLTMSAWKSVGVNLPHSAAEQYRVTKHVTRAELRPGDLVFYFHPIHHVGIYIGADKVINAPTYGEPVKISPITLGSIAGYSRP
ncbi:MAG TPA: NlpC/P60 family protein [Micromonosporaceae bacterium]